MAACAALACIHDGLLGFPCMKRCALHAPGWDFGIGICVLPLPPQPVGLGRGAQPKTDQGERLSEALAEFELDPIFGEHRRLPAAKRSEGTRTIGSPSLCLLSLGDAREGESPAGARPGLLVNQAVRVIQHGSRIHTGMTTRKVSEARPYAFSASCKVRHITFPDPLLGKASTNCTTRGYL